jgi:hypothetical protein
MVMTGLGDDIAVALNDLELLSTEERHERSTP